MSFIFHVSFIFDNDRETKLCEGLDPSNLPLYRSPGLWYCLLIPQVLQKSDEESNGRDGEPAESRRLPARTSG